MPSQPSLQKAKWLKEGGDWRYMKWCRQTRTLIPTRRRLHWQSLQHAEAVRLLSFFYENLRGDIFQEYAGTTTIGGSESDVRHLPARSFAPAPKPRRCTKPSRPSSATPSRVIAVRWTPDPAYIQHHGRTPTSGHYTTILATGDQHCILDDEKPCASSQLKLMIMHVVTYT